MHNSNMTQVDSGSPDGLFKKALKVTPVQLLKVTPSSNSENEAVMIGHYYRSTRYSKVASFW